MAQSPKEVGLKQIMAPFGEQGWLPAGPEPEPAPVVALGTGAASVDEAGVATPPAELVCVTNTEDEAAGGV